MRRAVFLDRDGVLNRAMVRDGKPVPPTKLDEVRVLSGVREACQALHEAGFVLVLVDNLLEMALGPLENAVTDINLRLRRYLQLEDARGCPRGDELREAARDWGIDLGSSYFVGDRWRDVEAAQRAGCQAIFVDCGYRERRPSAPYLEVRSLREAAHWIVESTRKAPVTPCVA